MGAMDFAVLGELRATQAGVDRTPAGQRSRDLLAVLLLRRGQAVEPATLLDLVWGEDAVDLDASVVHTQVARIRRTLGADAVRTTDAGYRVNDTDTDADRFLADVQLARATRNHDDALVLIDRALARWRADEAYVDVTSALVEAEAARLADARAGALELRAELLLRQGTDVGVHTALDIAEALVTRTPLREHGHELAMLATWRLGRQAEALEAYERLRRLLRDELGVDPGAAARELHARMLAQDPSLNSSSPAVTDAAVGLPAAPVNRLIGREQEVDRLRDLITERPLVTVTGPGGVGKSRLLAEVPGLIGSRRCVLVDLAAVHEVDTECLAEAIARALGLPVGATEAQETVLAALAGSDLLLLIDEAERNVAVVAGLCSAIVRRAAQVSVVVASRRPLEVTGEALLPIGPLPCPAPEADRDTIAASPAVQLLRERIADVAPDFEAATYDARSLDLLARFARRVDGLPLALELVAGHARTRSLADLDEVLAEPLTLAAVEADRPDRHRTLRDVIQWSVERVPAEQARALRRLGVFAGPFSLEAACVVVATEEAEQQVRALIREGLIHLDRTGDGFVLRLLRPVRDLALTELEAGDEHADVRRRHRRWHAERWRGALRSDALLFDVRDHYSDYVAALASALEDADGEAAGDLAMTLTRLWTYTDMLRTGLRWSDRALDAGIIDPLQAARIRALRSNLLIHHDPARVRVEVDAALAVLTAADDSLWLAGAHLVAALEHGESGDTVAAVEHGRAAVKHSRRSTPERQADALGVLAAIACSEAPEEAEAAAREAWGLARRSGSVAAVSSVGSNVAWALIGLGLAEDAYDVLTQALAERTRIVQGVSTLHDPDSIPTFFRLNLAWADLLAGRAPLAVPGFAAVIEATPDALEDRKAAEIFLGAGAALAALDDPGASEILAGATALIERTALYLHPWQEKLLASAVERAGGRERWSWSTDIVTGQRLADLVRTGADSLS